MAILTRDQHIANETVYAFWKRNQGVRFTQLARPALAALTRFFPQSPSLISFQREMHPLISAHSASPPLVSYSDDERRAGERVLQALGVGRPFICVHNRDSAYLSQLGGDPNVHDFRDFEFEDLVDGARLILDRGYSVVRIGKVVKDGARVEHERFVSATGSSRSDFADIYLISECEFFVGGTTGISHVSRLFRKAQLLVNYIPFRLPELSTWAARSLVIPKKLYSAEKRRMLRLTEMAALPYDIHYKGDFFSDHGLSVIDNSSVEIAEAIVEMEARVNGSWADTAGQRQLQDDVWKSMADRAAVDVVRGRLGITLGSMFLERNSDLI